ncbi:exported hypothetical protein [Burkholderiales bacterium]|nr:exported hypothetical protein [Burkholderiales bacterium]
MNAWRRALGPAACRAALCLLALALCAPARAQGAPPAAAPAPAELATVIRPAAGSERYRLARVFYGPIQRHELDVAEASALAGLDPAGNRTAPATVHFNGWLSGPGRTHAWINGTPHVSGSLAAGQDRQIELRRDDLANSGTPAAVDAARFDPRTEQLVIVNESGQQVRLRAGQSEDEEALLPLAAPREPARRQQMPASPAAPVTDAPSIGERP